MYTTALQGSHGIATTIYLNNSISSWIQGDGITSGRMIFKLGVRFKIRIKWITLDRLQVTIGAILLCSTGTR
ncbi:hypothetical protein V6N11_050356 [Hibiscus sabdariffa]|uniref:Uncharacterized protein n=1 Tax=Hibiscus sabdariffa TaxID=183260 RepID=A0ABR2T9K7_9ROSI